MASVPKMLLTPKEYLALERKAEIKSEYYRGETFAMAGASYHHTLVKDNLAGEARQQLKQGPCQMLTSDMRVKVESVGLYTYPDLVVASEKPKFEDDTVDTILNPTVLIEVLSKSTENYDRGAKFGMYRQIPSLQEFVLVAQDKPLVERYVRQPEDGWLLTEVRDREGSFGFASVPVSIPMTDIYRGVEFPATTGQ